MNRINDTSLRQQVYGILREDLKAGLLQPGQTIKLDQIAQRLGISRTPLREALLQLELEGFVTIKPRSGIVVRRLTEQDIRHLYQMIGALESSVLSTERPDISPAQIADMRQLNSRMQAAVQDEDFDRYYAANLALHNSYLELSTNPELVHQVAVMKQRLYDFTPRRDILRDWEESSTREHEAIVTALEQGDLDEAARLIREVHWSFTVQEKYIRKYYLPELEEGRS
jgi:DNA-binding GntR family transcriptional regulator|nr:GntR family transcriptional regulator [Candidatus Krumholzibacteria bacterium]